MTEARRYYTGDYAPDSGALHSVPINSTMRYAPNKEILGVLPEVLNQKGRDALAARAIQLSARTMRFDNLNDAQRFKANHIVPLTERNPAHLTRVRLRPQTTWESVQTPRGEAFRIFMGTAPEAAVALNAIHKIYVEERSQKANQSRREDYTDFRTMVSLEESSPRDRLLNRTLSFMLPKPFALFDAEDGNEALDAAMKDRQSAGALLYAEYIRTDDLPAQQ